MKRVFASLILCAAVCITAFAQTNTITNPIPGARSSIAIDGDRRTSPDFAYNVVVDNDAGGTYSADFEVWFKSTSPADSGGTKAKIFCVEYHGTNTLLDVKVPTGLGTSTPYIKVKNVYTGFSREWQATLTSNLPQILKNITGQISGYHNQGGAAVQPIPQANASGYIIDPLYPSVQKEELCLFINGADTSSTAPVINFADDGATISQNVSVQSDRNIALAGTLDGYRMYCVPIPNNIRGTGPGKLKVKGTSGGSWSGTVDIRFGY